MGNICRSPTAEGVFRQLLQQNNLLHCFSVDSAGTHDYHIGRRPDSRAIAAAANRGIQLDQLRARQVAQDDFKRFDFILAADLENREILEQLQPSRSKAHIGLIMDFAEKHTGMQVPDPYYGGSRGFEQVLDMLHDASGGLLRHIKENQLHTP